MIGLVDILKAEGIGINTRSLKIHLACWNGREHPIAGLPLREPVVWGGPIVMNTQAELDQAFAEIENGTFIQ